MGIFVHILSSRSDNLKKIYLAGGMTGLTYKEQHEQRLNFISQIRRNDSGFDRPKFFDPPLYYDVNEVNDIETQKEAMDFDLFNLCKSDVVVVNFNVPNSIGTAMEIAIAREHNIPVIGLNEDHNELHPWLRLNTTKICDSMEELVAFVKQFFLD